MRSCLPLEEERPLGIGDGSLRLRSGVAEPDDLVGDLDQASAGTA
jgi:cystathionine beta-lyase/cystathionine gamma-synthase